MGEVFNMKIVACCGSGLVSSFIIQTNVEKALKELEIKSIEVEVSSIGSAKNIPADIYIGGREIAGQLSMLDGKIITLNNIIDSMEIRSKLAQTLNELNYAE
ncbi:PTS sugar transporter subunit IIB [Clostridium botulinum C/D]|nr:PTS system, IIB component [Clostridium botulinum BKT015925]MCD3197009.1 PTS sugar transporter subunit IIB [Clostridium botulinum C/D]NFF29792.1 PTS sugar transporter subunit IIB [Clostridium botulinum]MCD3202558.1 PTS sugar transporter subunit IIB [Clostridium botulinum C/D]MCD3210478.1 PTS sugar transporter subunit IIB [Clostridium botulinum C/D]